MASKTIQIEIPITVDDQASGALASIQSKLTNLGQSATRTSSTTNKATSSMGKGFQNIGSSAQKGFESAQKSASGFEKTLNSVDKKTRMFSKEKIEKVIKVKDKASSVMSKIISTGKSIAGKTWNVTVGVIDKVTAPVKKLVSAVTSPLAAAGITVGATASLADVIQTYTGFESEMSKVKAISGATADQFVQLTAKAKEMGATTKFTAEEAGQAFEYMAMAGWKPDQMMSGISGIMNLAAASGEDLATTSDIVTDALTAFNLTAEDSTHFADVMAQASANANTNVGMMGQTFQYVAPIAGALGYSIEDTAQAIGLMANSGIKGEKAGTALRSLFTRLADPPKDAAQAIDALGISITNSDGSMRSLSDVMGQLRKGFAGLTEDQKAKYASDLAGQEAMSGLLAIVNASEDSYNQLAESIANADGASQKMTDTMLDNVQGKWTIFKSALDGVKIAMGERLKPYLMDAIQWLTDRMPDLQEGLMHTMDKLDQFVSGSKRDMNKLMNSQEWQNADFFGRIKLSFDTIIGDPFTKWWNTKGKKGLMSKVQDIGKGLGTGISAGILTILGIDVSSTINDGATIGTSFAKGFAEGFNGADIKKAFLINLKGLFQNASGLFSGGGLGSLISAAIIAKMASPILKGVGTVLKNGKGIAGGMKSAIGSYSMGSMANEGAIIVDSTGNAFLPGAQATGLLGGVGKLGTAMGATTTAGSLALGGATIAGAIGTTIGTIDTIRQGVTASKAYKSGNEEKGDTYKKGAWLTGGSMAAGAAAGAAIGSIIPGLGTAVGAIAGGLIGATGGFAIGGHFAHKSEKDYEDKAKQMEKYKLALEGTKFESKDLQEAFDDASVSADEFGASLQKAASEKIQKAFGKIKLSSQDISDITKKILFDGDTSGLDAYSAAASDAANALSSLQSSQTSMQKANWMLNNGLMDSQEDMNSYIETVKNLQKSTKDYLTNSQYQAQAAFKITMPKHQISDADYVDYNQGINKIYSDYMAQYQSISDQIDQIIGDGVISSDTNVKIKLNGTEVELDEQSAMESLEEQMNDITSKIADAQFDANMSMLNVKFSGAALDPDSYQQLIASIQQSAQDASDQYDQAFKVTLTNLNLELADGAITQDDYDKAVAEATQGYTANIQNLQVRIEGFEFQSISDAFGSSLDGILPDLEGTAAQKLQQVFDQAVSSGINLSTTSQTDLSKMFGLEGLSGETQAAITSEIQQIYNSLPDQVKNVDTSGVTSAMNEKIQESFANVGTGGEGATLPTSGVSSYLANMTKQAIDQADLSGAGDALNTKLNEALTVGGDSTTGVESSASGLTSGIENSVNTAVQNADLSGAGTTLNTKIGESLTTAGSGKGTDLSGITTGIQNSVNTAVENADLSTASTGLQTKVTTAMNGLTWDFSGISAPVGAAVGTAVGAATGYESGVESLHSKVKNSITSKFSGGFDVTTSVRVKVNWSITNPKANISTSGSGNSVKASIKGYANGGFIDRPALSMVGEDGPEAVIPLGQNRRDRGIELWSQAADMLGIPKHAEGGIFNGGENVSPAVPTESAQMNYSPAISSDGGSGKKSSSSGSTTQSPVVTISSPQFNFNIDSNGNDSTKVMNVIRKHMNEIADELGGSIADRLNEVFSNMPA